MEGEKRENIAVYHPIYGKSFPASPFSDRVEFLPGPLESPSIKVNQLKMADAGRYTCEFATYPSGNEQGTTTLIMLSKPKNSASPVTVQAGTKPVVVAQCAAVDGKPAADISWQTAVPGNHSITSKEAADGTVTVRSEFRMVPTAADHGKELTCVVTQRTQDVPQSFPMKLSVEYPPTASIQGYDENWYRGRSEATLVCETNSNPPASVTWTSLSGPMPDTVRIEGNRLIVRTVDETVNTTFVCEVKNRLGVGKHQLTTIVIDQERQISETPTGMIIGVVIGVLIILLIAGAVFLFLRKRRMDGENGEGPPKHKPPPPANKKHESSAKMLDKPAEPPVETEPLSQTYYETSVEPVTDLDVCDDDVPPTGASNGGTPSALEDTLQYNDEANESANDYLPPYSSMAPPPDNVLQDGGEMTPDPPSTTVSRGESFMSAAMYV
ncbi:PVR cell adhesion molecule related 2 like isoform X1 [Osmerus eperlanus]|uniref:PVR cell adhesion molecule related 2 like isoform X1 n=1 Tax=Osmerus eperlanus TaxID=29151 RepID=UPI002E0D6644